MNNFSTKFINWYITYQVEITWFIIGLCTFTGIDALARENYLSAVINFGLAYLNYILCKR